MFNIYQIIFITIVILLGIIIEWSKGAYKEHLETSDTLSDIDHKAKLILNKNEEIDIISNRYKERKRQLKYKYKNENKSKSWYNNELLKEKDKVKKEYIKIDKKYDNYKESF